MLKLNKHHQAEPKEKGKLGEFDCGDDHEMTRLCLALPSAPTPSYPAPPPPQDFKRSFSAEPRLVDHSAVIEAFLSSQPQDVLIGSARPAEPAPQASKKRARRGRAGDGAGGAAVQLRSGKQEQVPAAYPWADTRRARVLSLETLLSRGIREIAGTLQCKRCEKQFEVSHDLVSGFKTLATRIAMTKAEMSDRAPEDWQNPTLPSCRLCGADNSAEPVAAEKKRSINWLFLLLSGLLGRCTLDQLKYFCKHTGNHRTGAKNRVLYLTYLSLCNQLQPDDLFDPHRR